MDFAGAATLGTDPELYALKECGKRMADVLNGQIAFGKVTNFGRWMAFDLEDGSSDGTVYDTRDDAIAHARHSTTSHYEMLRPASYSADECALTLAYARALYESGWRPESGRPAPIMPVRREDAKAKIRQLHRHARRRNHR